ncbi:CDP-glycerol glycerophosphotransferase family protein [Caldibacillus thermolactis]|jgi:CDP-glycerol glycerophosphotransferase|uniref:CDP-glycerol glycerophosphotransferase family protein n=1 Tax=Pallidibacillus thermolactis TaxID=251051 RepID=A0ABT2WJD6_9BACI|nr:CDP-glycerol glycerophosphotransferase family protein [Pallidibacillus thermolactis]MCU9595512.1 CDP-glycerol glycerophosphotransferase family protein [Pallidibacillus thermolactis]MCU9599730.1 CDP-glycerol glycerophosphotransferase family protein [Pallidibacillus thermolactis subsp. kokeshiiformis]
MKQLINVQNSKLKTVSSSKLKIRQANHYLVFSGNFADEDCKVEQLYLISNNHRVLIPIVTNLNKSGFFFKVPLKKIMDNLLNNNEQIYTWYFKVKTQSGSINIKDSLKDQIIYLTKNNVAEFFIPCGYFDQVDIQGLSFYYQDHHYIINYISDNGFLSVALDSEPERKIKIQIDKVKTKKNIFKIEGKIKSGPSFIKKGVVFLRGRETDAELTVGTIDFIQINPQVKNGFPINSYQYKIDINFTDLQNKLEEEVYDVLLRLELHDKLEVMTIRVGRPTTRARIFLKELYVKNNQGALVINPYYTFKMSNLSLEIYKFDLDHFNYLRRLMRWSWLIQLINKRKNIWIVGERVYKAQDTGYAFFKFMRTNYPDMPVYYVMNPTSSEYENVEKYDNVLNFKSKEHIKKTLIAKKVISSHHPDYLYPIRTERFKNKVKADRIFLQHGIMGTKNMVANYGKKSSSGFETDFFIVSSDFEKKIVVDDLGYKQEQVFVTGLSRFDTLFEKDMAVKRQILVIPTWRDWLISEIEFLNSEYFERYKSLINNNKLHQLAKKFNFSIVFCLHPNMQKFSKYFQQEFVKIIFQGQVNVQHLIKESILMITDYSSVGFDFSFLNKPVIYYQFDRKRFLGGKLSHLDLDKDLPGEICFEELELLNKVEEYAEKGFVMKHEYKLRSQKFLKYRDQSACERIYQVIKNNKSKRKLFVNSKLLIILKHVISKWR